MIWINQFLSSALRVLYLSFSFFWLYVPATHSELKPINETELSDYSAQAGITTDQNTPLTIDSVVLDLHGDQGLNVYSGNLLDEDPDNDKIQLNYHFQGLTLDITDSGQIEIGLPHQLTIGQLNAATDQLENGLEFSYYLSKSAEIRPTTFRSQSQTYTVYANSIGGDPEYSGFRLNISGARFDNGSSQFRSNYRENEATSNTDGRSVTFTVNDPADISLRLESDDKNCGFLRGGCDHAEIILVDDKGDLVARAGNRSGFVADLDDVGVRPRQVVDRLGSNFFVSARMSGSFRLDGTVNVFSGTAVEARY